MKIAALSDLHLGYRSGARTVGGRNLREVDVERAWGAAVDRICEIGPDVVTIAGDVFHSVTPSNHALAAFRQGLLRITDETDADVVIIGGNHETPKTAGVLCPNVIFALSEAGYAGVHLPSDRIHPVVTPGEVVQVADGAGAVHCYGFSALSRPEVKVPTPWPGVVNILLVHGAVRSSVRPGALPTFYSGPGSYDVARADGFDVVACGDYHERRLLAPSFVHYADGRLQPDPDGGRYHVAQEDGTVAFYSGSIERTSSDIWHEYDPKGFYVFDTEERVLEFVTVPTRPMYNWTLQDVAWSMEASTALREGLEPPGYRELPAVDLASADIVNEALAYILADERVTDTLVRLVVAGLPRAERDAVDWKFVGKLRQRCALFRLDIGYAADEVPALGDRRERRARSLADEVAATTEEDGPEVRELMLECLAANDERGA
jgi:DNA repair exonuclease SbcCD nuclease subunit